MSTSLQAVPPMESEWMNGANCTAHTINVQSWVTESPVNLWQWNSVPVRQ